MTVSLWEWNWRVGRRPSARGCTRIGYDGVQVAPPQDSVKRTSKGNGSDAYLHPWWEVYQAVDYGLTSRMGDERQFRTMVVDVPRGRRQGLRRRGDQPHDRPGQHVLRRQDLHARTPTPTPGYVPERLPPHRQGLSLGRRRDRRLQQQDRGLELQPRRARGPADRDPEGARDAGRLSEQADRLRGVRLPGGRGQARRAGRPGRDLRQARQDQGRQAAVLGAGGRAGQPWRAEPGGVHRARRRPGAGRRQADLRGVQELHGSDHQGDISGLADVRPRVRPDEVEQDALVRDQPRHEPRPGQRARPTRRATSTCSPPSGCWPTATAHRRCSRASPSAATPTRGRRPTSDGIIDRASCDNGQWTCDHRKTGVVGMVKFHRYVGGAAKRHVYADEQNVLAFSRGTKGWAGFNNNTARRRRSR